MSILSELWRNLTNGKMTATEAWSEAETKVETDVGQVVAHGGAVAQVAAQAIAPVIKQGLSDAIGISDTAAVAFVGPASDTVAAAFTTAVTGYLGPLSAPLAAAGRDAIYKVRDLLKSELDAQALAMEASLTTPPAAPATAAPQTA